MGILIRLEGIEKSYLTTSGQQIILSRLDLNVEAGEYVAIMGASGSGKSTLLHIMGCLDRQTAGQYYFAGKKIDALSDAQLSEIRATKIGFVFQHFYLLPHLSVFENVALPFFYRPDHVGNIDGQINQALQVVGLADRSRHRPSELSGGEMQRVAIARVLITRPQLILADEPTGSLDSLTSSGILDIIKRLNQMGVTIVLVTHDPLVASQAGRIITIKDGRFVG